MILSAEFLAQDSLKKSFPFKLYSLSANGGVWIYSDGKYFDLNDYKQFAGENTLVKDVDFKDYREQYYGFTNSSNESGFTILTSFIFHNKKKKQYNDRHQLNIGFLYLNDDQELNIYKDDHIRFDTLKSNSSATMFFIDTVKRNTYDFHVNRDQVAFSIGYSTHGKQNRIFSLYTGLQLMAGISNANVKVTYRQRESFEDQNKKNYDYEHSSHSSIHKEETTKLKRSNFLIAYMPVGGVLRFSKMKKNIVKQFALNAELRFGAKYENMADNTRLNPFFSINFGIKFFLQREKILRSYRPPEPFN